MFVVALATAAGDLHHGIAERHLHDALVGYGAAFATPFAPSPVLLLGILMSAYPASWSWDAR